MVRYVLSNYFVTLTRLSRIDGTLRAKLLSPDTDQLLDITIEFKGERPDAEMQLKVTADIERQKYEIRINSEKILRRVSPEKNVGHEIISAMTLMLTSDSACDKSEEIVVELFECSRKLKLLKKEKVLIFSIKALLEDDVLYTEETYTSESLTWLRVIMNNTDVSLGDDNTATIQVHSYVFPEGMISNRMSSLKQ